MLTVACGLVIRCCVQIGASGSRLCSESIWRAPESFRFAVDEDTMLAPAGPPTEPLPCGPLVEDVAAVTISLTRTGQQPPWGFEVS